MILGVDISTSITGIAVIDDSGKLIECAACDLRKHKGFFEKALHFKEFVLDVADKHCAIVNKVGVDHIYIEQPFTFFNSGGSSAKTMATLQRFNGVASWMFYEVFDLEPQYVGANQARKKVGLKIPRGTKAKQVVMEHLLATDEDFKVEYTHYGNPRPQYYDMADALIVARAGLTIEKEKLSS
jgi:Holliday junction resolvasome RuvABC endonuclease subunit